ncbi:2-oxo acid dehydrogenase subunit E2 [Oerskovia turbata]
MSAREFRLPDLGEGLTESDLVTWHVAAGDRVELNQVIAEVETAKALVDLPSPYAGVVTALHAEPGQTVNVGEPLVTFEVPDVAEAPAAPDMPDGAAAAGPAATASATAAAAGPAATASATRASAGPAATASAGPGAAAEVAPGEIAGEEAPQPNLVGYGARPERSGRPARRARRAPAAPVATPTSAATSTQSAEMGEVSAEEGAGAALSPISPQRERGERPRSTPPVRRLAKQLGVHIDRIVGTGARGLVTREDVLTAVSCAQGTAHDADRHHAPGRSAAQQAGAGDHRLTDAGHAAPGASASARHGAPEHTGPADGHGEHDVAPAALDTDEHPPSGRRSGPTSLRDLLGQSGLARAAARRTGGFPPPEARETPGEQVLGTEAASSGRDGRVERGARAWAVPSGGGDEHGTRAASSGVPDAGETRTPVRGVRKHTAAAMVASASTAPQATVFLTVDVTPSVDLLDRLRTHPLARGARITVLALVARALCAVLPRHPALASRWEGLPDGSAEIVHSPRVRLGIAVATDRGLVVPHVPDAHTLGLVGLAEALADLTATARAGRTAPERLAGGTITITNVGVFGVDAGTPILVPGEAAILGVGAVRKRPWEHEGQVALRDVVTLSLTFDHRVVDGEQGARFLAELGALLADPALALLLVGDPGASAGAGTPDGGGAADVTDGGAGRGGLARTAGPGTGVAS